MLVIIMVVKCTYFKGNESRERKIKYYADDFFCYIILLKFCEFRICLRNLLFFVCLLFSEYSNPTKTWFEYFVRIGFLRK